jgi:VIT1/CCC1 family predicted Fe2+/Mn2+ transporter
MEEIEVPTEKIQEDINEKAMESRERWTMSVALTSAILAAFAAVTALMSGHHSNEAMIEQLQASDQWGYYQAKGIKSAILNSKIQTLQALGKSIAKADQDKADQYAGDQEEIKEKAAELEKSASQHLKRHLVLARGVTLFQVAIAVAAISILTRRRRYFTVSLCFGLCGLAFLIQDILL